MSNSFAWLDGKPLAIDTGGRFPEIRGVGRYVAGTLEIEVKDPEGRFTVVLDEANWCGKVQQDPDGFTYRITLTVSSSASRQGGSSCSS